MSQEIEIEYKNLLTKGEYDRVHQLYPFESVEFMEQTNYYFESDDLKLRSLGAALRIRKKNDQWTLTLKQPHPEGLLETHDSLSEHEADLWIQNRMVEKPNVGKQLEELGVSLEDLKFLGSLTTRRKEIEYKDTLLVLDHSLYYDQEDFELELEAQSKEQGKSVFSQILNQCNIPERETDNKIKRFYKARQESE